MERFLTIVFFTLITISVSAQVDNDECFESVFIDNISRFCSLNGFYDNTSATTSPDEPPQCWPENSTNHDVWFSFVPTNTAILVQVIGDLGNETETLQLPSIAVYSGSCRSLDLEGCSSVQATGVNAVELALTDIVIGRRYYLRVGARNNNVGTFQLCLDQFNPQIPPEADCSKSVTLCNGDPFFIEELVGTGEDENEVAGTCIQEELASVWYKWTVDQSGTLEFTLTPTGPNDDIDFAVYRLPGGLNDCDNKELVRCMASGESSQLSASANLVCAGPTGLRAGESDTEEFPGCENGSNNFVAPINMLSGDVYALVINNFSQSSLGFSIDFGGSGTFLGPEPIFDITPQLEFECDKLIFFTDESIENGDNIISYEWNFGEGATPLFASGNEPHEVVYESFGSKVAALTVLTSRGCQVTEIIEFDVEPCCSDDSDLELSLTERDLTCFNSGDGQLSLEGVNGFPDYLYSINGGFFQPNPDFSNLDAGTYNVGIQDIKGCEVFDMAVLTEPVALTVDASTAEDTIDLGFSTFFSSEYGPLDRMVTYEWSPPNGLECTDCPNPEVFGLGDFIYTLTITDEDGCQAMDQVSLFTNLNRNFYTPNVLSLSSVSGNDEFKVITNPGTEIIEELSVFDRWGGRLYHATDIVYDLNDGLGWRGEGLNDQTVNPGVYVWMARIRFVDGETIPYKGTITVIQ